MTEIDDATALYRRLERVTPKVMRPRLIEAFVGAGFKLEADTVVGLPVDAGAAYHDVYAALTGMHTAQIAARAALAGLGVYV